MIESADGYKFFATVFSVRRLLILFILYFAVLVGTAVSLLYLDLDINWKIFFLGCLILAVSLFFISNRYVKIVLSEISIAIYYWGKLKYEASIHDLKYVQGIDIEKTDQRSVVKLIFKNRKFRFSIWGIQGAKVTNDAKLIKMLVSRYQLQKEFYGKRLIFIHICRYLNPQFTVNTTESPYNKKEK